MSNDFVIFCEIRFMFSIFSIARSNLLSEEECTWMMKLSQYIGCIFAPVIKQGVVLLRVYQILFLHLLMKVVITIL